MDFRFVLPEKERQINLSLISYDDKQKLNQNEDVNLNDQGHHQAKRIKLSFKQKKKLRGQNKSRGPTYQRDNSRELCIKATETIDGTYQQCTIQGCKFIHNVEEYMKIKPKDIASTCYNYSTSGKCMWGVACRFGSEHLTSDGKNIINEEKFKHYQETGPYTKNVLCKEVQTNLRKKLYNFELSEKIVQYNDFKKNKTVGYTFVIRYLDITISFK